MESMQDIKVPVCRLCLEVDCYSNFQQLENGNYLKLILPDLNYALTTDPVICSKCKEMLQKSSCFKTACKQTEDHLKNIRINNTSVFNELFNRELGNDTIKENIGRCRLCLREAECCSALCVVKYMLEKCFPEMDMTLVQNPVICNSCIEDLQGHYNLIVSCLDIEDKIRNYHVGKGVTLNNTNLHEIRLSSIKMESRNENYNGGSDDSISKRIKLEDEFRDVKTIKTEEISVKDGADGEQKKGKMAREVLNPQSRKLVLNVVEYFQNKKESSYESICVINCAAEALKLSPRTISRIRQEGRDGIKKKFTKNKRAPKTHDLPEPLKWEIRDIIYKMTEKNQIVTRKSIQEELKNKNILQVSNATEVLERPEIVAKRVKVLRGYENNKISEKPLNVVFLDEIWIFQRGSNAKQMMTMLNQCGINRVLMEAVYSCTCWFIEGAGLIFSFIIVLLFLLTAIN